uniref:Annexin n=1 Tax=Chelonoidis abingdonii TaxID=106734 RepID=A0A8C0H785_CHEAB
QRDEDGSSVRGALSFDPTPDAQVLYKAMKGLEYGSNLEEDIKSDTSGYFERILVCLLQRDDPRCYVDSAMVLQDAQALYAAGEKIRGTDEIQFITILCTRSATHLLRVFDEYQKLASKSLEDSIRSETHGSLEDAMLAIGKEHRTPLLFTAKLINVSLQGAGTCDGTLIRVIVSRSEIDLNLIKAEFLKIAGKSLSTMILEDTSGDYKTALLNLCGSDK